LAIVALDVHTSSTVSGTGLVTSSAASGTGLAAPAQQRARAGARPLTPPGMRWRPLARRRAACARGVWLRPRAASGTSTVAPGGI